MIAEAFNKPSFDCGVYGPTDPHGLFPSLNTATCKPHVQASKVLQAFNRMTGRDLTEDELNTLSVLLEVFGRN